MREPTERWYYVDEGVSIAMEKIRLFFEPKSVALIGATDGKGVVGRIVLDNLLLAKDRRKIYPVNPNREKIFDLKCYPNLS